MESTNNVVTSEMRGMVYELLLAHIIIYCSSTEATNAVEKET